MHQEKFNEQVKTDIDLVATLLRLCCNVVGGLLPHLVTTRFANVLQRSVRCCSDLVATLLRVWVRFSCEVVCDLVASLVATLVCAIWLRPFCAAVVATLVASLLRLVASLVRPLGDLVTTPVSSELRPRSRPSSDPGATSSRPLPDVPQAWDNLTGTLRRPAATS